MVRRTKDDWRQLIEQQAKSQLSIAEFCRQHDIARPYFQKKKKDLSPQSLVPQSHGFIKLEASTAPLLQTTSIEVSYQQAHIRLPRELSPLWLAEFVKALS